MEYGTPQKHILCSRYSNECICILFWFTKFFFLSVVRSIYSIQYYTVKYSTVDFIKYINIIHWTYCHDVSYLPLFLFCYILYYCWNICYNVLWYHFQWCKEMVVRKFGLIAEVMDVEIYLLDLHPNRWTLVANSPNFPMNTFFQTLNKMYYEFLLTKYFFWGNPVESTNVTNLTLTGLVSHFNCCKVMAKSGCANFAFHNTVSINAPTARFNNFKTKILELMFYH